jgi:hypothetical protein
MATTKPAQDVHTDVNGHLPPGITWEKVLRVVVASEDDSVFLLGLIQAVDEAGNGCLFDQAVQQRCARVRVHDSALYHGKLLELVSASMPQRWRDWDKQIAALALAMPGTASALPPPETLTELLAAHIPPPRQLFDGLMHEGMLLFGGKSKRGKSWLMFDLALALAVGRSGFRHFSCPTPLPVLYLALEDGRARLQGRARAIQPNITTADALHLRYTFPSLSEGGIEALHAEIARYHYGLVVIDVLAKVEHAPGGKNERSYHDIYDMFTPLQDLRKQHPFCLAMLTHLRKQEAEDVFDSLLGSVAYQGAQDVLWVLERKPKDDLAFLHIRDKDAEDQTIALRFLDGHWEYIGEGEEYEVSRDSRRIIQVLNQEPREFGIPEIMKAASFKEEKYAYVRNLLVSLVKDDFIHRTKQGRYSATVRAAHEFMDSGDLADYDDGRYGN